MTTENTSPKSSKPKKSFTAMSLASRKQASSHSLASDDDDVETSRRTSTVVDATGNRWTREDIRRMSKAEHCVINPESNRYLRRWDFLTVFFLLFVCFVTPYEVAFLHDSKEVHDVKGANALFWINRVVDAVFVVDMVLQFFIMYPVSHQYGTMLVSDRRLIMKRYLRTWFTCDLLSILPFDIVGVLLESNDVSKFRLVKVVRLLRLLKLARLLRSMRLLKRWQVELSFSYRKTTLLSLLISVVVATHLIACTLGIMNTVQGNICQGPSQNEGCAHTWLSVLALEVDAEAGTEAVELNPFRSYTWALYVAATIVVHPHFGAPQNDAERLCLTLLLFIGGFLWTRVISKSLTISTSLDRHNMAYNQQMDDLNCISQKLCLPRTLRLRLRAFFMNGRNHERNQTWKELTSKMSPSLRLEVLYHLNRNWVRRVSYLAKASKMIIQEIIDHIVTDNYSQDETFGSNFMLYILSRGVCSWAKGGSRLCILLPGSVWGEEHLLLNSFHLLVPNTAHALTYCEVLSIDRASFRRVCQDHPSYQKVLHRFYLWWALIRGVVYEANRRKQVTERLEHEVERSANLNRRVSTDDMTDQEDDSIRRHNERVATINSQQQKAWRKLSRDKDKSGDKKYFLSRRSDSRATTKDFSASPRIFGRVNSNESATSARPFTRVRSNELRSPCNDPMDSFKYHEMMKHLEASLKEHLDERTAVLENLMVGTKERLDRLDERTARLENMSHWTAWATWTGWAAGTGRGTAQHSEFSSPRQGILSQSPPPAQAGATGIPASGEAPQGLPPQSPTGRHASPDSPQAWSPQSLSQIPLPEWVNGQPQGQTPGWATGMFPEAARNPFSQHQNPAWAAGNGGRDVAQNCSPQRQILLNGARGTEKL